MTDVFKKEKRSEIMRAVKSKENITTELKLIKFFKNKDIKGWRRNYPLYGKPDFVFPKAKLAVFTDGCFWHGHGCRNVSPATNKEYWEEKIRKNKERDKIVNKRLKEKGWHVIRIWECQIKESSINSKISKIEKILK